MPTYARDTSVSVQQSQLEMERTLERYGATGFMRGWDQQNAFVAFELKGRRIRFIVPMPDRGKFATTENGRKRTSQNAMQAAWEQACRQRWRAFNLVVKAKLEAIDSGISTLEDEFMAFIQLPSGQTVGQWMQPQIEAAYQTGVMPPLLPIPSRHDDIEGEVIP